MTAGIIQEQTGSSFCVGITKIADSLKKNWVEEIDTSSKGTFGQAIQNNFSAEYSLIGDCLPEKVRNFTSSTRSLHSDPISYLKSSADPAGVKVRKVLLDLPATAAIDTVANIANALFMVFCTALILCLGAHDCFKAKTIKDLSATLKDVAKISVAALGCAVRSVVHVASSSIRMVPVVGLLVSKVINTVDRMITDKVCLIANKAFNIESDILSPFCISKPAPLELIELNVRI